MFKVATILSIMLVASATSAPSEIVDAKTMNDQIMSFIELLREANYGANIMIKNKFGRQIGDFFWQHPQKKGTIAPQLNFNDRGEECEIVNDPEISDQSCRDYVRSFPESDQTECSQLLDGLTQLQRDKIEEIVEKTIAYLNRNIISSDTDLVIAEGRNASETWSAKIKSIEDVVKATVKSIDNLLNVARETIRNYVKEFSYCLIHRKEYDLEALREWWDACAFYTQVPSPVPWFNHH